MNSTHTPESKHYPSACTSAFCGKSGPECNSECRYHPMLLEFKQWVAEHQAVQPDHIWLPLLYVSTR